MRDNDGLKGDFSQIMCYPFNTRILMTNLNTYFYRRLSE